MRSSREGRVWTKVQALFFNARQNLTKAKVAAAAVNSQLLQIWGIGASVEVRGPVKFWEPQILGDEILEI